MTQRPRVIIHNHYARPVHDAGMYGPSAVKKTLTENEARATGASLTDYLNTTKAVRDWCRAEGINRGTEAYVVEGFRKQRMREGLSENV